MKHLLTVLFTILLLFTLSALAEGTTLERLPLNEFGRLVYSALGERGMLTDDLQRTFIETGCAPEDTDFDRFYVRDSFTVAVKAEDGAPGRIFTSFALEPALSYDADILALICAFDGQMNWLPVSVAVNNVGGINVIVTQEQAQVVAGAENAVFFLFHDPRLYESPLYRDVAFPPTGLDDIYTCSERGYDLFGTGQRAKKFTAKKYYEAWNKMILGHEDYVTRMDLGFSSDDQTVCSLYTFRSASAREDGPKIIIVSGQHGYEKAAPFGLYYFANDLLNNWENDSTLTYLHDNVTLLIMPLMNPYGFDNYVRFNANGVDLNRNYDVHFSLKNELSSGPEAFSERETRMVRGVVEKNLDALCLIDFHNYGWSDVRREPGDNIIWHSYTGRVEKDAYYGFFYSASERFVSEMVPYYEGQYRLREGSTYGRITTHTNKGGSLLRDWALSKDLMAMTFELPGGLPGEGVKIASTRVQRMNAEFFGNWLRIVLDTYAKWGRAE
ncbi:MAG: DUF2817 domain-containing protein [Clostridiales bacterium]|nr:DUF2817 domain-containing protein [Clostridiales bacterium]